jgi:hypothetical protein
MQLRQQEMVAKQQEQQKQQMQQMQQMKVRAKHDAEL